LRPKRGPDGRDTPYFRRFDPTRHRRNTLEGFDPIDPIDAQAQETNNRFRTTTSVLVAVMAVLLAFASVGGSNAAEDAMFHNVKAADTWAFFQAKNIRQTAYELEVDRLQGQLLHEPMGLEERAYLEELAGRYQATAERYDDEPDPNAADDPTAGEGKKQLIAKALDHEAQRDAAFERDASFDYAEGLLQVAIVLASVAMLGNSRLIRVVGLAFGGLGTVLMLNGYLGFMTLPL